MKCPCSPNKTYESCCAPIHRDVHNATTAELLMRSRYSAFVLANGHYLSLSHHHTERLSKREMKELIHWTTSVQWLGLQVMNTQSGGPNDDTGIVEFKAHFIEHGKMNFIHERSKFVRENGHWVYLNGGHQ